VNTAFPVLASDLKERVRGQYVGRVKTANLLFEDLPFCVVGISSVIPKFH